MYKKRPGTSGIHGYFYETKLLSLILFRAQNDENIEQFYLASNMDDIGAFDDVFFKVKIKGYNKPLFVFMQAKHRENDDKILTLNSKEDLVKYFKSYLAIKDKFNTNTQDNFFNEQFDKSECKFIIYTNEKGDVTNNIFENNFTSHLNGLISTGPAGSQPLFTNEHVQHLSRLHTVTMLANRFAKFLYSKNNQSMMNDEFILPYHVILAQNVVVVSEIQGEHRTCKFKDDFFNNTDKFLALFRDELYGEILKMQKLKDKKLQEEHLRKFLSEPSEITLCHVIGSVIIYKNGKFESVIDIPADLQGQLNRISFAQCSVNEAVKLAVENILKSSEFSVPPAFGNTDLKLRGNSANVEKRLNYLTDAIVDLIEKSKPSYVVTLNESVSDGILRLNGGLGSAIGNLLVYDNHTNLIKFTDNDTLLKCHAKSLLNKLKSKINNLHEYCFDVKDKKFPKLSCDNFDESLARDFLSKLVFYTSQGNQNHIELILKQEIEEHHNSALPLKFPITSDAIFLKYHDKIQKWWMSQKETELVPYFTKSCDIYQETLNDIVNNPYISSMNLAYMNEIKLIAQNIQFSQDTIDTIKSLNLSRSVIVTDGIQLTSIKIIQCLKCHEYVVLDFYYIYRLLSLEFKQLKAELSNMNQEDPIVIIYGDINTGFRQTFYKYLSVLSHVINNKNYIIITQRLYLKNMKEIFQQINETLYDKLRFIDLSQESQRSILKTAKVIFQGQEMNLNMFIENVPIQLIEGAGLNEIVINKTIEINQPLNNSDYNRRKDFYVDRRVSRDNTLRALRTFLDIDDDVVLITAVSGMGKSTLLTHLSLTTNELDRKLWIVRINLIQYSIKFREWEKDKTDLNILNTLQFICEVAILKRIAKYTIPLPVSKPVLLESNDEIYLHDFTEEEDGSENELIIFELKLFLHFFNKGNVMFLFDGFDEICPHYVNIVIALLNVIKFDVRKNKMLVASRLYSEIQTILENNFGVPYVLETFTIEQLNSYLDMFWKTNLVLDGFNHELISGIRRFLDNVSAENIINTATLSRMLGRVHVSFISYLITYLSKRDGTDKWSNLCRTIKFLRRSSESEDEGEASTATADHSKEIECPLLTFLAADYFVNFTKRLDKHDISMLSFHIDVSTVYHGFIESLVQKHYEDKCNMSIYNPAVRAEYEIKLAVFFRTLKKVAAYSIFSEIFKKRQLQKMTLLINQLKEGVDKTGIICSVINDVPQFVHKSFAEYLAVEYLFDWMMTMNHESRRQYILLLSEPISTLCVWINQKLAKEDYQELRGYFIEKEDIIIPFPVV